MIIDFKISILGHDLCLRNYYFVITHTHDDLKQ